MAKGIIVVEMPEKCGECMLAEKIWRGDNLEVECPFLPYDVDADNLQAKEPYCPIHLMPEKKPEKDCTPIMDHHYFEGYEDGWNDCVDYLEGENGE